MGGENTIEGKNTIGIFLKGDKLVSEDKKEEKDKKLSEGGSMPQASSDQASAIPKDLIKKYGVLSKVWEGKKTEEGTLIKDVDFGSLGKGVKIYKNKRELFARAMVEFLKKFKIITDFENRITDEVISNDESYTKLVDEILDIISKKYKGVPEDVIDRYEFVLKSLEDKSINLQSLEKEVGNCKSRREQFARAMVVLLKKVKPGEKIITDFESRITNEPINDDGSYRNLIKDILDPITPKKSILDPNEKYKDVSKKTRNKFSKLAEKASTLGNQVHIESLVNSAIVIFKLKMKDNNVKLFAYAMLEFLNEVNKRYEKSGADEKAYDTFKSELGKLGENDKEGYNKKAEEILNSIDALLQRVNSAEVPKELVDRYKALYEKYKKLGCKLENPDQVIKASKQNSKRKHFVHVLTKFLEKNFDKDSQAKAKGYWEEMEGMKKDDGDAYAGLVNRIFDSIDNAKPHIPPPSELVDLFKRKINDVNARGKNIGININMNDLETAAQRESNLRTIGPKQFFAYEVLEALEKLSSVVVELKGKMMGYGGDVELVDENDNIGEYKKLMNKLITEISIDSLLPGETVGESTAKSAPTRLGSDEVLGRLRGDFEMRIGTINENLRKTENAKVINIGNLLDKVPAKENNQRKRFAYEVLEALKELNIVGVEVDNFESGIKDLEVSEDSVYRESMEKMIKKISVDKVLSNLKSSLSKIEETHSVFISIKSLLKEVQGEIPDKEKENERIKFAYAVLQYLRELTVKDDLKTDFDNDVKECEENVKKLTGDSTNKDYSEVVSGVISKVDKWLEKGAKKQVDPSKAVQILKENTNNILRRRKNNKSNNSAFTKPSMIDDNVLKEKVTNANESHNLNFSKAIGYGDAFTKPSMIDDNVLKEDVTNAGNLLVDLYTSDYNKLVKEFLDKKKDGRTEEDLKAELNKKADDKLKKRFEEEQQLCEEKDKGKLSRAQELNKSSKLIMYKFLELMNCLGANEGKIEDFRKQINEATDGDLIGKICKSTKDLVDKYSANSSPLSNALNQPSESELPPPPLPQNFSDPECQKQVIEKFLKNRLSGLIKQVKMWGFLDDNYNYDENIYCSFDYPSCKFLENVRVFWLKIAEIIYGGIKKIPSDDISYEIISFQNRIGNCLPRTEMQSLLSTDDFVKKSNSFLDYISNKILGIDSKNLLETKKSELIKSKDDTLNKLVSKYNELYKDDKHELTKNEDLFNLQCAIEGFWNILKGKLENGTKKEKKRAGTLNDFMDNYFKSVVKNNQVNIATYKDINHVKETFDQELNIIGRVILYLEKRKNKENEKGFFGKLFGKSKKSNDETKSDESNKSKEELKKEKKQKKEKLNNQKRLKKCFEDMGRYFVKHKKEDKVKLSDFKKLVKGKDPYATWSTDLGNTVLGDTNITKSENGKIEKKLLMGLLFLSLIDLGDKESVIAACDGLKAGGIKSNDTKLFEGKATSIRKAIKGKCSIDIRKDDLGDYIASLCGKYDLVEKTQANLITFKFVNEWKNESSSADTPEYN